MSEADRALNLGHAEVEGSKPSPGTLHTDPMLIVGRLILVRIVSKTAVSELMKSLAEKTCPLPGVVGYMSENDFAVDGDASAANAQGPNENLPEQVPAHVAQSHDRIRQFLDGSFDASPGVGIE